MSPLDSQRDTAGPMGRSVEDVARLLDVMAGVDPGDDRTATAEGHIPRTYTAALDKNGLNGARIGVFRQTLKLQDGADPRVVALLDRAIADMRAAGAEIVEDFTVLGFESFPRPPQTAARTKADWETFFAYEGPSFPVKTVAALRDAPLGKGVHPLHAARVAEIAAAALEPEHDPQTVQGRKDEQMYRDTLRAAMDTVRVDALVFPVWTFPPKVNGDRGQTPQGSLSFIGSATQWPVVVVPMGFVGENLPIGLQILGRPWSEGRLIGFAYAYEQFSHHRRPPPTVPPLAASLTARFIGTWRLVGVNERETSTGIEKPALGHDSGGQLVYSADGRFSLQIIALDRSNTPGDFFSNYYGRWEIVPTEGCVVHHQEGNPKASDVGETAKRYFSFDDAGRLSLATPPGRNNDGRNTSIVFVWERL